jgi:hypothetical protein
MLKGLSQLRKSTIYTLSLQCCNICRKKILKESSAKRRSSSGLHKNFDTVSFYKTFVIRFCYVLYKRSFFFIACDRQRHRIHCKADADSNYGSFTGLRMMKKTII